MLCSEIARTNQKVVLYLFHTHHLTGDGTHIRFFIMHVDNTLQTDTIRYTPDDE